LPQYDFNADIWRAIGEQDRVARSKLKPLKTEADIAERYYPQEREDIPVVAILAVAAVALGLAFSPWKKSDFADEEEIARIRRKGKPDWVIEAERRQKEQNEEDRKNQEALDKKRMGMRP